MKQFEPVAEYLPHDNPMILLDKVLNVTDNMSICQVTISHTGVIAPFINKQNQLPAWFAIEMMAQTIGVWQGWHAKNMQQKINLGLLLGGRGFKTIMSAYPLNSLLTICTTLLLLDNKLASFDCQLMMDDIEVTSARLNVYQPDEAELLRFTNRC